MTRRYWVRGYETAAADATMDAATCREGLIGNVEALIETAAPDHAIMEPVARAPGAAAGLTLLGGPFFWPIQVDRDGALRRLSVAIFAAGGAADVTCYVYATETYRNVVAGASGDPNAEVTAAAGATCDWTASTTLTPRAEWVAAWYPRTLVGHGGDERVRVRGLWLTVWADTPLAGTLYSGLRVREVVRDL